MKIRSTQFRLSNLFYLLLMFMLPSVAMAQVDSNKMIPLMDMGQASYVGFEGGLYENGSNEAPDAHAQEGLRRADNIKPLDVSGTASDDGKIVMMSIGMSNTTQEFCSQNAIEPCNSWTFKGQTDVHPDVNHKTLEIVNGARGSQSAEKWDSASDLNYNRIRDDVLRPKGLTEAQVQIVWVKIANARPTVSLPNSNADAFALEAALGNTARAIKTRYPNIKLMFASSRVYGGYATTDLNPEPFAYESGFSVRWLIEAQVKQNLATSGAVIDPVAGDLDYNTVVPWVGWGAYLWANGETPRSDGLIWVASDFEKKDFTHPFRTGEEKVGGLLLEFFLNSPYTRGWFSNNAEPPVDTTAPLPPKALRVEISD